MAFKENKSHDQGALAHSLLFQLWRLWMGTEPGWSPSEEDPARALPLRTPGGGGGGVPGSLLASTSCLALGKVMDLIASYPVPAPGLKVLITLFLGAGTV